MKLADYLKTSDTSQATFARLLGISQGLVHQWIAGKRPISAEQCPVIERLTGGAVTCEELNDKVDWAYVRRSGSVAEGAHTEIGAIVAAGVLPNGVTHQ